MSYIIGGVLILLGLVMTFVKIGRNPMMGVRLPWTYADKEIWYKTNKLFGILSIIWGLLLFSSGNNLDNLIAFILIPLIPLVIISIVYPGWLYYAKYGTLRIRGVTEEAKPKIKVKLRINFWWESIPLGLLVATFLLIRFYYPQLPTRIPIHFNLSGVADGWGSRGSLYGLFGVMVGLYLFLEIGKLGMRRRTISRFGVDYYFSFSLLIISLTILFTSLHIGIIYYTLGRIQNLNTMLRIPWVILGLTVVYIIVDAVKKSKAIEGTRRKE